MRYALRQLPVLVAVFALGCEWFVYSPTGDYDPSDEACGDGPPCGPHGACSEYEGNVYCACQFGHAEDGSCLGGNTPPLESLEVSRGSLHPPYSPDEYRYSLILPSSAETVAVRPRASSDATIVVNDRVVPSGVLSHEIELNARHVTVIVSVVMPGLSPRPCFINIEVTDQFAQEAYVKPSDTAAGNHFGERVAASGDLMAVASTKGVGAVHVFRRADGWSEEAVLEASDGAPGDRFGASVAVYSDLIAVGAPGASSGRGAVYVFARSEGAWTQQARLEASQGETGDAFGESLALAYDTLVVGAPGEDGAAQGVNGDESSNAVTDSGSVYVFARSETAWTQQTYIKGPQPGVTDRFGFSVALYGDELAVGAPGEDSDSLGIDGNQSNDGAPDSGAVFLFERAGTSWSQEAYFKASNAEPGDGFGTSVALSIDSWGRLVVGAPAEDGNGEGWNDTFGPDPTNNDARESGAVYIFGRESRAWREDVYLKASNTGAQDRFGSSLALSGWMLAVGAPGEDSSTTMVDGLRADDGATNSGAVYLFDGYRSSWDPYSYVKSSNAGAGDAFGASVALTNDLLLVGAGGEDGAASGLNGDQTSESASDSGAAYVFRRSSAQ